MSRIVNLNTVSDAAALEPALAAIFANPADRRFAALELFRFLETDRNAGRSRECRRDHPGDRPDRRDRADAAARGVRAASADGPRGAHGERSADRARHDAAVHRLRSRRAANRCSSCARATRSGSQLLWFGGLYLLGFQLIALVVAASRHPRRSRAAGGGSPADRRRLRGAGEPRRSAARQPAVRPVRGGRARRPAADRWRCRSSTSAPPTFLALSYLPLIGALSLSVLLIVFGNGPGRSNAKVNLGPVQPIEAIRLLLALFLAGYLRAPVGIAQGSARPRPSAR